MTDPTIELSVKDELDWKIERSNEIAAICWKKCEGCNGRGFNIEHWEADEIINPQAGTSDYVMRVPCAKCKGEGEKQLHDPWRVEALYDAADDARKELGVWCYTRITSALVLAVNEGVDLNGTVDFAPRLDGDVVVTNSESGKRYLIRGRCNCYDSYYKAPKINGKPHCKHFIAVELVKAANKKMYDQEPTHYGPFSDALDGLISVEEAEQREAGR